MILFFIGFLEMIIATAWTRVVTKAQIMASGFVTLVNIFIWYYVLQRIISDISNTQLIVIYALGCAIGTMFCTAYFHYFDKICRRKNKVRSAQPVLQENK
ncbi:MAG: DUF5698 domain-containing protein [Patescibacteria group bacterium]|nr:DUF5698 domain-containing protein [Patescibacteria group bacterium]